MSVTLINPQPHLDALSPGEPPPYGYLLFGATVAPPKGPPFVRPDATRKAVLTHMPAQLDRVMRVDTVVRATGYRAVLIPPGRPPSFRPDLEPPRFDLTVLVETESPDTLSDVAASPAVAELGELLDASSTRLDVKQARCVRAIADVDKSPRGTYLFNYWAAADPATALEVFDHLAPWFQAHTGLRNSTVLQPIADDDFAFVNHARWDAGPLTIGARQLLRPSFHRFVRPTLAANQVEVYPALYRRL